MDDRLSELLIQYAYQTPLYLVWLTGIILALVRWRHHPGTSLMALHGFGLFLLQSLVWTFLTHALLLSPLRTEVGTGTLLAVLNGAGILVRLVGWVLLLVAVFAWRTRPAQVTGMKGPRDFED